MSNFKPIQPGVNHHAKIVMPAEHENGNCSFQNHAEPIITQK